MTKQVSIILALVVLALVASAGFWYVSRTRIASMPTQAAPVVVPKPAEPVNLTYTDPEYPFAFDYPSFVSWNGQVSLMEVGTDSHYAWEPKPTRVVTLGPRGADGKVYGIEFRVYEVTGDLKSWVAKSRPESKYVTRPGQDEIEVLFDNKEEYTNETAAEPCWDISSRTLYNKEKGFLVQIHTGGDPAFIEDQYCTEKEKNTYDIGACSKDGSIISSLHLTK